MDNELLEKLLKEHNRLIIPGFGAFLRKEGQPSAPIVFSPFLKKDDGVLTQILKTEYGVDNFDAETMTSEWVAHVKESLNNKGKYEIDGIGLLVMDANGAIAMVAEQAKKPAKPIPSYENHQGQPTIIHANEPTQPIASQPIAQPVQTTISQLINPQPEPIAPQPVAPQPIAPQPIAQQPIAQQPIAQQPIAQQPIAQQPIAPQPIAQQPIAQQPIGSPMSRIQPTVASPSSMQSPIGVAPQPLARAAMPINPVQQPRSAAPVARPMGGSIPSPVRISGDRQWERPGSPSINTPTGNIPGSSSTGSIPRPTPIGSDGKSRPDVAQQQRAQQPARKRKPSPQSTQKQKVETLLIVAIVAAIVIVALIIYGLLTVNPTTEFYQPPM